jgi:SAM-dependent methyltransferase
MEYSTYEVEAQVEAKHWWFIGRRKLFGEIIKRLKLPISANILDIGTSTGTNLRMLRDLGFKNVRGMDLNNEAIRWCFEKGLGQVDRGDICNIPYLSNTYDLVLATDIIEHVDDDLAALSEINRILKPNGFALISVPAFQSLWGLQDTVSHHKRRYRKSELIQKLDSAQLLVTECFYFNYLLFIPIYVIRQLIRIFDIRLKSENELNPSWVNAILLRVFLLDVLTAKRIKPKFGVSILALAARSELISKGDL